MLLRSVAVGKQCSSWFANSKPT